MRFRFFESRSVISRLNTPSSGYAAFISYNRMVDRELAHALQSALHRFAKPWYRLRALRVFRDDVSLAADPSLWGAIENALDSSEFFILLACPESAKSKWVNKELGHWIQKNPLENVLIVLTGGEDWDIKDLDWNTTTALPPSMRGRYREEPRYADLRWVRSEEWSDSRFRDSVADLAARLHHKPKDDLVGEDVRQHRRTTQLTRAVVSGLIVLLVAASVAAVVAVQQRQTAAAQRNLATSRQLAAQAEQKAGSDLQSALLLAAAADKVSDTPEARATLARLLQRNESVERSLTRPGTPVRDVAFSADGRFLAAARGTNGITLWDLSSDGTPATLEVKGDANSVAFSPDGATLAIGEGSRLDGGTVGLWDVSTKRRMAVLTEGRGIETPAFSPDGRLIATTGLDTTTHSYPTGKVVLWDAATHAQVGVLSSDSAGGRCVFSPDGLTLAVTNESDIALWNVATRSPVGKLEGGHSRGVLDFAFSPDGTKLASGGHDAKLVLWDVVTRTQLASWTRGGDVSAVAFSPDGRLLAAGDNSASISFWDVAQRTFVTTLTGGHTSSVDHLSFSADGRRMVSGGYDGKVVLWRMGEKTNELAVATLRPAPGSREAPPPVGYRAPNHVAFSPDSAMLAWTVGPDIELWDVPRRAPLFTLLDAGVDPVFSPDGRTLATATNTGVALWDVATRTRTATLTGNTANARPGRPVFSPDGDTLAASVGDSIVVWQLADRTRSATLASAGGTAIAFSPDGSMLAGGNAGSSDIALWEVHDQKKVQSFPSMSGDPVYSLSFSPDGKQLAWSALQSANTAIGGDYTVFIWNIADKAIQKSFTVHTGLPLTVAFSPDGTQLAWDGSNVLLWSIALGGPIMEMKPPQSGGKAFLHSPVFSSDGRLLATQSSDGSIILWDVGIVSWINRACAIAGRDLTPAEWKSTLPDLPYQPVCGDR